jgi:hypothetical protein
MSLGRFLEVSVAATDIVESLEFYESLGFVQAVTGEAWPHPYAVVTDGRLAIGLHGIDTEAPVLTWVAPELGKRIESLTAGGLEFESMQLDELSLNQATFVDPTGQRVRLLEARTFSPPDLPPGHTSALGYFAEYALPVKDCDAVAAYWERLGFVAFDGGDDPFRRVAVAGRDLNLGLYGLDLRAPLLVFTGDTLDARVEALRARGFALSRRLPRGLRPGDAALMEAPEGTQLLLTLERDVAIEPGQS